MSLLNEAIEYAQKGWHIFPCFEHDYVYTDADGKDIVRPEKSPRLKNGLLNATTDLEQIEKWWKQWPESAIGTNCGLSGIIVIDIDNKTKGKNGFLSLAQLGLDMDDLVSVLTPNKGMHIYFKGKSVSRINLLPGIDVRSDGGLIILPPSRLKSNGKSYIPVKFNKNLHNLPEIPDFLAEKINHFEEHTPSKNKNYDEVSIDFVARMLKSKDFENLADDYDSWIRIGMALRYFGEDGFYLWDEWSRLSPKYKDGETKKKWKSFNYRDMGNIGIGTLLYYYKKSGKDLSNNATDDFALDPPTD